MNCGHPGDGSSTVCEICGNPYIDMPDLEEVPTAVKEGQQKMDEVVELPEEKATFSEDSQTGASSGKNGEESQSRAPYSPNVASQASAQGRTLYGSNGADQASTQGRTLYGSNGAGQASMRGRAPYDSNSAGQNRAPYPPNGQPQRRMPDNQGRPVRQPQQNGAAPRQGMYGQQMMQNARKAFHSPLFLIITILYTAAIAGSVASVFLQELSFSQILQMLTNFDAPNAVMTYAEKVVGLLSKIDNGTYVIGLGAKIPDVFLCLGFWIAYLTSGAKRKKMSGVGFVFSRIALVVKMIVSCLLMLAGLLLAVTFVVSAWVSDVQETKIASVIFLAALIVLTMFIIMFFFSALHTVSVCSRNVKGETGGKVSVFTAILTILIALCSVISLLSAIVNVEIGGMVGHACKIGWMVLAGFWIILYRGKVNREKR
jgi:hypothetical protein